MLHKFEVSCCLSVGIGHGRFLRPYREHRAIFRSLFAVTKYRTEQFAVNNRPSLLPRLQQNQYEDEAQEIPRRETLTARCHTTITAMEMRATHPWMGVHQRNFRLP